MLLFLYGSVDTSQLADVTYYPTFLVLAELPLELI
jgi:hypothetical protein